MSSLELKNITILGRRTSIRLEPEMWVALKEVTKYEGCLIHDLCSLIYLRKKPGSSLTASIRVFLMLYYRAAATEQGHSRAGRGNFTNMKQRAGMPMDWSALKASKTKATEQSDVQSAFMAKKTTAQNSVSDQAIRKA